MKDKREGKNHLPSKTKEIDKKCRNESEEKS